MTPTGVVARLAVRELWISFRLLIVLIAFVAAGAVVALLPAAVPVTMTRLSVGLGAATIVVSVVAAWSMAEERQAGRAGWLVSRSLPRGSLLAGWFVALAGLAGLALAAAALLGWLAATTVAFRLEAGAYVSLILAIGATTLGAIALGLLAGTLLPGRTAAAAVGAGCLLAGAAAWLLPLDGSLVPGGAYASLAALTETQRSIGPGLRATGVGLAVAAALLVAARAALEDAEL